VSNSALITGISGQDGSYLAEYLLSLGYDVHGVVRRNSVPEYQTGRLSNIIDDITLYYGDITDPHSLEEAVLKSNPNEVYNLAAQSHVRISFDIPKYTLDVNGTCVVNLLEIIRKHAPEAKFYQASSSEMFGVCVDDDDKQRETTPMHPTSPYGCAKLMSYSAVRHYRRAYGLHVTNGILFNHTSRRRGSNFVESKIVNTAIAIKDGKCGKLVLGNMDSYRDWGFSADYVKAMHLMLQQESPDDFVIATGKTRSVRDLCDIVFTKLDMDYRDFVVQDERYMRPEELPYLCGDASKAESALGWHPETPFDQVIEDMIWRR